MSRSQANKENPPNTTSKWRFCGFSGAVLECKAMRVLLLAVMIFHGKDMDNYVIALHFIE